MHYYTWFPLKLPSILCFTQVSLIPSITLLVSSWERVLHFLHPLEGLMHHQDITDLQNITYLSGLWSFNQAKGKQTLASGTNIWFKYPGSKSRINNLTHFNQSKECITAIQNTIYFPQVLQCTPLHYYPGCNRGLPGKRNFQIIKCKVDHFFFLEPSLWLSSDDWLMIWFSCGVL